MYRSWNGLWGGFTCYIINLLSGINCNSVLKHSPLQSDQINAARKTITGRRVLFAILFMLSMAGSLALAALALSPGGFSATDVALLLLFAITLPWMVAGFWNGVIGFLIMRFSPD